MYRVQRKISLIKKSSRTILKSHKLTVIFVQQKYMYSDIYSHQMRSLSLNTPKCVFVRDPAHSAPPDPPALRRQLRSEGKGVKGKGRKTGKREGRRVREGRPKHPPRQISGYGLKFWLRLSPPCVPFHAASAVSYYEKFLDRLRSTSLQGECSSTTCHISATNKVSVQRALCKSYNTYSQA